MDTSFIEDLASSAPTPGGGGASAYCGALASALASMVGNLTVGKRSYADVEDTIQKSLRHLAFLRERLICLVEADAQAFQPLAAVYRMPKDTPEEKHAREMALQEALVDAIEVPLRIMHVCEDVLHETEVMSEFGSKLALSDAGVAAVFAKAAIQGASLNVRINISSLNDVSLKRGYELQMDEVMLEGCALADRIYASVVESI